jgi:hypothetical protein
LDIFIQIRERNELNNSEAEKEDMKTVSKALSMRYEAEIADIAKILGKKPEPTAESKVLEPYKEYIEKYDDDQNTQWGEWRARLPKRIVNVTNMLADIVIKARNWQYLNYLFIILAAAVPIIVSVLTEVYKLPYAASAIDLVFPVAVGIMEKILSDANKKKTALISIKSPYETLLSNIVMGIYQKTYSTNKDSFEVRWEKLDTIRINAGIAFTE